MSTAAQKVRIGVQAHERAKHGRGTAARVGSVGVQRGARMYLEDCSRHSTSPGSDEQGSWSEDRCPHYAAMSVCQRTGGGIERLICSAPDRHQGGGMRSRRSVMVRMFWGSFVVEPPRDPRRLHSV